MDTHMDGWIDVQTAGSWMDRRMERWIDGYMGVLRDEQRDSMILF